MPEFFTVRKTAVKKHIPENYIRRLIALGKCPGFYSGNRFMVNATALMEQLDTESRKNVEATK